MFVFFSKVFLWILWNEDRLHGGIVFSVRGCQTGNLETKKRFDFLISDKKNPEKTNMEDRDSKIIDRETKSNEKKKGKKKDAPAIS